jgi:Patatin-like phospholipase
MAADERKLGVAREIPPDDAYGKESQRVNDRRATLGIEDHPAEVLGRWGLAISGGGIRSATFGLGVLQGLAALAPASARPRKSILWYFDYLSTVSGGGYIGSFFCSLFVPGRLKSDVTDPAQAAASAYDVLKNEPPGRLRHEVDPRKTTTPGEVSLAWLRDNGRYLAPTGSGDMFYAAALAIRNWASLHYVIGTVILAAFAFLAFMRSGLSWAWNEAALVEGDLLIQSLDCLRISRSAQDLCDVASAKPCACEWSTLIWWSVLLALPVLFAIAVVIPSGAAYWLGHPHRGESASSPSRKLTWAVVGSAIASATFGLMGWLARAAEWQAPSALFYVLSAITFIAVLIHVISAGPPKTVTRQRVDMTRLFSRALKVTLVLLVISVADTLGQTVYRALSADGLGNWKLASVPSLVAAIVWLVRKATRYFDQKESRGWLAKVPVEWLAGVAGLVMLACVALLWQLLVQWIQWQGGPPDPDQLNDPVRAAGLLLLASVTLFLGWITGLFPGFINLSSLQWLYSARLTRAYLGASNGARFDSNDERALSAAEPHAKDELSHKEYYAPAVCAPMHLINVTMNLTSDPVEQLVQRDRKGKPMAVGPFGFSLDGRQYEFASFPKPWEHQMPMRIGQWIGTSGAAVTTGLGRSTSLGMSLALGLANVRLGTWWESGAGHDESKGFEYVGKMLFKSQTFLGYELLAQFHGTRREWQYLSDGGHFENSGVYELLRPERRIRLVVACDNGCDPKYQFGELANLIRLARIDHRIEIEVRSDFPAASPLASVFGAPEEFNDESPEKCAVLLEARPVAKDGTRQDVSTVIVLLKPRLIPQASVDVHQYAITHEPFPQEPTADQFFDEAQWESYRKLGRTITQRVFGAETGPALWAFLADTYGIGS